MGGGGLKRAGGGVWPGPPSSQGPPMVPGEGEGGGVWLGPPLLPGSPYGPRRRRAGDFEASILLAPKEPKQSFGCQVAGSPPAAHLQAEGEVLVLLLREPLQDHAELGLAAEVQEPGNRGGGVLDGQCTARTRAHHPHPCGRRGCRAMGMAGASGLSASVPTICTVLGPEDFPGAGGGAM